MKTRERKIKVGIVGCGAIGSRIARSITDELSHDCVLTGLYDINIEKSFQLAKKLNLKKAIKTSLEDLIKGCSLMVEAVSAEDTKDIIRKALSAKRSVLCMSVGKLLNAAELFRLAKKNNCSLLVPSGAIAGLDAIKAAGLVGVDQVTLTTRKPTTGFRDNPYFRQRGIDLTKIKKETTLFHGRVDEAVKVFPQNINVAATLALAGRCKRKLVIRIMTSPQYKTNSHEIEMTGDFGRISTRTDNVVCPDNPRTSYLAVLSGIQTLKQFCTGILIGT